MPDVVGGGTVAYVNPQEHHYLTDPVHREEGGTPAIVESIRAGLVFQLKAAVGTDVIRAHEEDFVRRAIAVWSGNEPSIQVLGNLTAERLSIVSFVIRRPGGRYLHHNLVVAILNDLFGIQARGGCSCAGPYGHRLLGIDLERSHEFEREITHGCEGIKPGWVRVNFNYFVSEAVFEYLVSAVVLIADHGWKLLPQYRFDPVTGRWHHQDGPVEPPLRLAQLHYDEDGTLQYPGDRERAPESDLTRYLAQAHDLLESLPEDLGEPAQRPTASRSTSPPCSGSSCPPSAFAERQRVTRTRNGAEAPRGWRPCRRRRRGRCTGPSPAARSRRAEHAPWHWTWRWPRSSSGRRAAPAGRGTARPSRAGPALDDEPVPGGGPRSTSESAVTSDRTCVVNGALTPSTRASAGGTADAASRRDAAGVTWKTAMPSPPVVTACTSTHFRLPWAELQRRGHAGTGAPSDVTVARHRRACRRPRSAPR